MRYPKTNRKPEAPAEHPPLPLESCLAKSRKIDADRSVAGRTVLDHCRIAGEVARELIARSPAFLREPFFPGGSALVAACHDLGKVSPTFQKKIHKKIENADPAILEILRDVDPTLEKSWDGHAGVSQCALDALMAGKAVASIAGCHHGYAPKLAGRTADAEQFGGPAWQAQRSRLLALLMEATGERFPEIRDPLHARVLAGLTSVADWIGSGAAFDDPGEPWQECVAAAVDAAGFTPPRLRPGLSFREIFPFEPNPIQRGLIEAACRPGAYILEAPMGIGKTEAALYAAYALASAGAARGIYFALPTQLTSNRIHGRVERFLDRVLEPDSPHRAALLLHGNAWLREFDLGAEAAPGCSWFNSAKRGLLAPFAVGTIDQALMASMNVKHGFVRAFGIAGKVVILDEVHSYDAYTGTILDRLVEELRRLRCTVIILSATLTGERRSALLGAARSAEAAYPLITALPADALEPLEIAPETPAGNLVTIRQTLDIDEALDEALDRADSGQQVLWIENTVSEAQRIKSDKSCELFRKDFFGCEGDSGFYNISSYSPSQSNNAIIQCYFFVMTVGAQSLIFQQKKTTLFYIIFLLHQTNQLMNQGYFLTNLQSSHLSF
jgi:CRISPR-associated endonuclease/helicase Cas3